MTAKDDFFTAVNEITEDYKRLDELEYLASGLIEFDKRFGYDIYSGNLMSEAFVGNLMSTINLARQYSELGNTR